MGCAESRHPLTTQESMMNCLMENPPNINLAEGFINRDLHDKFKLMIEDWKTKKLDIHKLIKDKVFEVPTDTHTIEVCFPCEIKIDGI